MSTNVNGRRKRRGSSLVETAVGLIFLIPIVLFLVDVAAMVVAQTENDKLAKACARAAAEKPHGTGGTAADQVLAAQHQSSLLNSATVATTYTQDPNAGWIVTCKTSIVCVLPVPVPLGGPGSINFVASATEPVVGELP